MDNVNYLLIAVLIAFAIGLIIGYRKGFLRLAVYVAGLILVVLIVTKISPYVSDYLINHTTMYTKTRTKIVTMYEEKARSGENESALENEEEQDENSIVSSFALPDVITKALISGNTEDVYNSLAITLFEEYIAGFLARMVIKAGTFVGLFIALAIAQYAILIAIKILEKIPILKTANRLMGMGLGFMVTLLFVWIFMMASLVFFGNSLGTWTIEQVNASKILSFIFNSNILLQNILS